jgi:hypothetical protein
LTIAQLQQILNGRQTELNKLLKQRRNAQSKVDEINRRIERIGGAGVIDGRRGGGTRVRNERSLPDVIEEVMKKTSKPMGVGPITEAVRATGYRSSSPQFRAIVNQTLIKERGRFQATGERGIYQLKK